MSCRRRTVTPSDGNAHRQQEQVAYQSDSDDRSQAGHEAVDHEERREDRQVDQGEPPELGAASASPNNGQRLKVTV